MVETKIADGHWNMILDRIYQGSCVPFLGAAVNASRPARDKDDPGYRGLPLGRDVALRLIEKLIGAEDGEVARADDLATVATLSSKLERAGVGLAEDLTRLGLQNLPRVALHFDVQMRGDRVYLLQQLREVLVDKRCEPSGLLTTLAQMPLKLIVTTNFDRLLERALDREVEQSLHVGVKDLKDPRRLASQLRAGADPVSMHLRLRLSLTTLDLLAAFDGASDPPADLVAAMAADLDRLIHEEDLYDQQRFARVTLTEEITALRSSATEDRDRHRLNRLLLEEAYPFELAKSRKPYELVVQPTAGFTGEQRAKQSANPPAEDVLVVYKIHGTFKDEKPSAPDGETTSDVVITEEDYVQFLTIVGHPSAGVPNYIKAKLVGSSLLFLGYSLEDWDFRTLYKGLIESLPADRRRTSFAIQRSPRRFWVDFWDQKRVILYDYDVHQFAEELEERYIAKFGSLNARKGSG